MPTIIPSRDDYYLENGKFILKSKWIGRIRKAIIAVFVLGSILEVNYIANATYNPTTTDLPAKFATVESAVLSYVKTANPDLSRTEANQIAVATVKWSKEFKVDVSLILALSKVESGFKKYSISNAGALGITQVIPRYHLQKLLTAKEKLPTPELFDINTNLFLGTWVLRDCLNQFKLIKSALLCYNGSLSMPNGYDEKVLATKRNIDVYMKSVM